MRTVARARAGKSKVGYARVGSLLMLGALVWVLWGAAQDTSNWNWMTEQAKAKKEVARLTVGAEKQQQIAAAAAKQAEAEAKAEPKAEPKPTPEPHPDIKPEVAPAETTAEPKAEPAAEPVPAEPKTEPKTEPAPESPSAEPKPEPKAEPAQTEPKAGEPSPNEFKQVNPDGSENKPAFEEGVGRQEAPPAIKPEFSGPTDLDDEEGDALEKQGQAISDGGVELRKEEMPLYWRMFRWVNSQTAEQLLKRHDKTVTLHDMMRRPTKTRGKIVKLNLHVTRVLSYDVADSNIAKVKKVYELWGWSDETKAWLYCGVTPELPDKMPLGSELHEQVTFVGYFYKVQGYLAANSRPNEKPLSSPLLIGRVIWHPAKAVPPPPATEPFWIWGSIGLAFLLFVGGCAYPFLRPKVVREYSPPVSTNLNEWAAKPNFDADADS